jgi:hypothetical protein
MTPARKNISLAHWHRCLDSADVLQDPSFFLIDTAHLAVVVAVDDVDADNSRFARERLCRGSLRDLHGRAAARLLLVAST